MGEHLPGNGKFTASGRTAPSGIPVLARREDFRLGAATIRPSLRMVEGPLGSVTTEPRVMQVLVAFFDAGGVVLGTALVALLLVFATLESVVGFCTGCWLFGRLMQAGVIPEATCQACNNVTWG